ncbi:MAG: hypothetical protein AAB317_00365 [Nitrospirota bacterium]
MSLLQTSRAATSVPTWGLPTRKAMPVIMRRFPSPVSIPDDRVEAPETSTVLELQRLIMELKCDYIFDNPMAVNRFLVENDYLLAILFEAPGYIQDIFGPVPIHLELHRDPEEDWEELFIVIKSPYSAAEAVRRERQLAQAWFLKRMKDTRGNLNFTEEPL